MELELVEVTGHADMIAKFDGKEEELKGVRRDPFSLVFRGPVDNVLSCGVREFVQTDFGRFVIFISPTHSDRDGQYYFVPFN